MKISLPGIRRRALIIRADGAEAYDLRRGKGTLEAAFTLDELALFQGYCQSRRSSQFVVLADLVEEEFQFETIPYVIGPTRTQLLARKFEQLYRNMPYRACASIGREVNPAANSRRRDERVLFMALTNQQALNPWLEVMHGERNQVRGVYSPALASSWLGGYAALGGRSVLAVTLNRAGLRQVYLENGQPRFSRLASFQIDQLIAAGPRVAAEIARTQQYLATMRWLRREPGPLEVLIFCPPGVRAAWRTACVNTDRLEFTFTDLSAPAAQLAALPGGLRGTGSDDLFADSLWASGLLQRIPKVNFAPSWTSEHFSLWRWRAAIVTTGAVACAAGIATGAVLYGQAKTIEYQGDSQMASMTRANTQYQSIAKSFPKTLTSPEQLRGAVMALDPLAIRPLGPEPILILISQALVQAPAFALDKIDWLSSANPDAAAGSVAPRAAPAAPRAPTVPATTAAERYEVVILSGALSQERAATPRRKVAAARAAIDALRRIPGVEVTPLRLPMDVSPTGALKGGDDDSKAVEAAEPIVLRVSRKVPA